MAIIPLKLCFCALDNIREDKILFRGLVCVIFLIAYVVKVYKMAIIPLKTLLLCPG